MQDLGKLLLRLTIGGLLIFYGIHKLGEGFSDGVAGIGSMLDAKGLPVFLKYGVYVGELIAPALLIVGFLTRIAGIVVAGDMAFAIYLSPSAAFGQLNAFGGWAIEHPLIFLLGGLAIALLGPGRLAIDGRKPSPA